jgi:hypothetical protein
MKTALFMLVLTVAFGADPPTDRVKALEVSRAECEAQRVRVLEEAETHSILSDEGVKFSARCVRLR